MDHSAHMQPASANATAGSDFFSTANFMPHGHCYLWKPELVALHVVSDAIIAFAYFCIPFVLYYIVKKRPDIPYKWVVVLFAAFILACGTTHVMEMYTLWNPEYWMSGFVKAVTAVISIATALALLPIVPEALKLRGPAELEKINLALQKEIEERKRFEEELILAARMKSNFLANMSHEIRTPLNGIIGLTNSVLDTSITADQRNALDLVRKSSEHLFSLLNDILDSSKIEAGKLEFESLSFNLTEFLQDTIEMHRVPAQQKGLALLLEIEGQHLQQVKTDPTRLRQILNNLIGNAIKFTEHGVITVKMKVLRDESTHSRLQFSIADTGIGIPEIKLQEVFNSFTQADASTSRRYGGSGLGLSICKKLVEMMNGSITVVSTLGVGTTFTFNILVEKSEAPATENKPDAKSMALEKNIRVLVAEDNAVNQIVTVKMLDKMGLRADYVANGKEVLDILNHKTYDVILMDCQMPEMDGYQATQKIRLKEGATPNSNRVKIIAMTASAMKGDRERCIESGMDDYITKPVRISDLHNALKKV